MEITEKKLNSIFKDQNEEFQRQNKVLYEKFRGDIKIIGEGWSANNKKTEAIFEMVGDIKEDVEMLKIYVSQNTKDISKSTKDIKLIKVNVAKNTEDIAENTKDIKLIKVNVAKNTEDISTIKSDVAKNTEDISTIKSDVSIIKYDLKEKVDRNEFASLEKRVILLENKIRKT